jgi:aspartate-semialdehyde dehydrogenase
MIEETHKILEDKRIDINPTCIRIPTLRSHLESITVELKTDGDVDTIRNLLEKAPGVVVQDNIKENKFPEPLDTSGTDNVSVGRIRRSFHKNPRIFQLIVSGDQIRKGAALNALQIYDHLKSKFFKHK